MTMLTMEETKSGQEILDAIYLIARKKKKSARKIWLTPIKSEVLAVRKYLLENDFKLHEISWGEACTDWFKS